MDVEKLLKQCKFSKRYQGYRALQQCIQVVLEDEESLLYVTGIYCIVAEKLCISWSSVERNIRTAFDHSWESGGREQLEKLAGGEFYEKPTVSEVIEILAEYVKDHADEKVNKQQEI